MMARRKKQSAVKCRGLCHLFFCFMRISFHHHFKNRTANCIMNVISPRKRMRDYYKRTRYKRRKMISGFLSLSKDLLISNLNKYNLDGFCPLYASIVPGMNKVKKVDST